MVIYSHDYNHNVTEKYDHDPVFRMVCNQMPFLREWTADDGDDEPGTNYCQYTYYEPGTDNYLLAAWYEIDEEKGCIKL